MRGPVVQYHGMRYLDVPVFSPLGLKLIWGRGSNRLFCWLVRHAPDARSAQRAEAWAFRR